VLDGGGDAGGGDAGGGDAGGGDAGGGDAGGGDGDEPPTVILADPLLWYPSVATII